MQIKLVGGKGFATIDPEDYDKVKHLRWYLLRTKTNTYAQGVKGHVRVLLHRLLTSCPDEQEVDHIDRNGLNNTKSNLRLCDRSQNNLNKIKVRGASKYRGVVWFKRDSRWRAQIKFKNKYKHLGYYEQEKDAARAYDSAAISLHGEFARLNLCDN